MLHFLTFHAKSAEKNFFFSALFFIPKDKSFLSFSLSKKADTKLVLEVLRNSFNKNINRNTILHTDRGSQFTSSEYKKALENLKITHSISRLSKYIYNTL